MGRPRHYTALLVLGLICLTATRVSSASDSFEPPKDPLPSRLPMLDESGLDKYSLPSPEQPGGAILDKEYPSNTVIPLDTKNLRYFSYFAKIQRRIDRSYYYPKEAIEELLNGIVTVSFEIRRNGSVRDVKTIGSSGKEILDEAAVAIIQKAAPFSNIPSRIHNDPLRVLTRVTFIPTQDVVQRQKGLDILSIPLD